MVCALDYEAGDPGSIPGSGGTTDWLFSAGDPGSIPGSGGTTDWLFSAGW